MTQYNVQGPDGTPHVIEGPDGATDDQIIEQAQQLFASPTPSVGSRVLSGAGNDLSAMGSGIKSLVTDTIPSIAKNYLQNGTLLTADNAKRGLQGAKGLANEYEQLFGRDPNASVNPLKQSFNDYSWANAGNHLIDHPVNSALDVLPAVSEGLGLVSKAGGIVGEGAEDLGQMAKTSGVKDIFSGGSKVGKTVPLSEEAIPRVNAVADSPELKATNIKPAISDAKQSYQDLMDEINNTEGISQKTKDTLNKNNLDNFNKLTDQEAKLKAATDAAPTGWQEIKNKLTGNGKSKIPLTTTGAALLGGTGGGAVGGWIGSHIPIPGAGIAGAAAGATAGASRAASLVPYGAASLKIAAGIGLENMGQYTKWLSGIKGLPTTIVTSLVANRAANDPDFKSKIDQIDQ